MGAATHLDLTFRLERAGHWYRCRRTSVGVRPAD
jgi:hypothetical protein